MVHFAVPRGRHGALRKHKLTTPLAGGKAGGWMTPDGGIQFARTAARAAPALLFRLGNQQRQPSAAARRRATIERLGNPIDIR